MSSRADLRVARRTRRHPRPWQFDYLHLRRLLNDLRPALAHVSEQGGVVLDVFCGSRPYDDLVAPTLIPVYAGANWHEREIWEMYGIEFAGHPDLRKLYLPTDFEGFPLRKDFPLLARRVKPWPGIVDVEQMPGDDEPDAEAGDA